MKTVKKWILTGVVETIVAGCLVLGAPAVINAGKPMIGFGMFAIAAGGLGVSVTYVTYRATSALKAKRLLLDAFPNQNDWMSLPVADFIDITPAQITNATPFLRNILEEDANDWGREAIEGILVITFIKTFSRDPVLSNGT